jgi:hypothetical protein
MNSPRNPSVSVELSSDEETKIQRKEKRKRERKEEHIHSAEDLHKFLNWGGESSRETLS